LWQRKNALLKNPSAISKSYHIVNLITFLNMTGQVMPLLNEYIRQLLPEMTQWRRDLHHYAESGWVEFRTASKVAEQLHQLGYDLTLGRDAVDADSRMGLPDESPWPTPFSAPASKVRQNRG
jgi:aminobenzoyl-glutamate utilization protein A